MSSEAIGREQGAEVSGEAEREAMGRGRGQVVGLSFWGLWCRARPGAEASGEGKESGAKVSWARARPEAEPLGKAWCRGVGRGWGPRYGRRAKASGKVEGDATGRRRGTEVYGKA